MKNFYKKNTYTIMLLSVVFLLTLLFSLDTNKKESDQYITVKVTSGDTLWNLAEQYQQQDASKKGFIDWVARHNDLDPEDLQPGTEIVIPVKKNQDVTNLASEQ
ncbi:LysM peptidoglycan-binding domain-containing protein [Peribacillus sp. SCS-155]|uniref:cell division suppressor protein YneA n=1 Tax=Peribacillus sedimenti TaxID=3115297 RepID=UPI003905DD19